MREESRREGELNEVALEGVSGGGLGYANVASRVCTRCNRRDKCGHYWDLIAYLKEHGERSVSTEQRCPYYNE